MHEWIVGVQKAAQIAHPGVSVEELRRAENELGEQLPAELADLYVAMSGGEFEGGVTLFKLSEPEHGVIEKTRKKLLGLPAAGLWRFGRKGDNRHLFAARASSLREHGETGLPAWCAELPSDAWLFGTWAENEEGVRVYRNLEHLLSVLVPPIETEDFGESTFVRALTAVEQALLSVNEASNQPQGSRAANDDEPPRPRRPAASRKPGARTANTSPRPTATASRAANNSKRTQAMAVKEAKQKVIKGSDPIADVAALIADEERAAKLAEKALRKAEKALRKAEKVQKAEKKSARKTEKKSEKKAEKKNGKKAGKSDKKVEKKAAKKTGKGEKKSAKKVEQKAAKKSDKASGKKAQKKSDAKTGKSDSKKSVAAKGAKQASTRTAAAKRAPASKPAAKAVAGKKSASRSEKKPASKSTAKPASKSASKTTATRTAKKPAAKPASRTATKTTAARAPKKPAAKTASRTASKATAARAAKPSASRSKPKPA